MVELAEELLLVHDRINTALGDNSRLRHLFHGEEFLFLSVDNFPDFAETAPPNYMLVIKVVFINFCTKTTNAYLRLIMPDMRDLAMTRFFW